MSNVIYPSQWHGNPAQDIERDIEREREEYFEMIGMGPVEHTLRLDARYTWGESQLYRCLEDIDGRR